MSAAASATAVAAGADTKSGGGGGGAGTLPVPKWTVELTPLEQKILKKLLAAREKFGLTTQLRVAGGWVRDKLLGRNSIDIDLALDNMMGSAFAEKVNQYLKSIGDPVHEIGVIKLNPEQSKHLETATFKMEGISIDVNNLRKETYDGSRIPAMTMGTAEEDAYRRDFTINAMFYNITAPAGKELEDFCKTGLSDLKDGLIRTPLPALQTFKDDPLRVLRGIRFAGRFGFRVDDDLRKSASHADVAADLRTKVSRERFGIELNKMLSEQRSAYASFELLCSFGLRAVVFEPPAKFEVDPTLGSGSSGGSGVSAKSAAADSKTAAAAAASGSGLHPLTEETKTKTENKATTELSLRTMRIAQRYLDTTRVDYGKEDRRIILLAAFLSPYYGYRVEEKKNKFTPLVSYIVLNSIKFPLKDSKQSTALIDGAHSYLRLIAQYTAALKGGGGATAAAEAIQLETGLLCRRLGADSLLALDLAFVLRAVSATSAGNGSGGSGSGGVELEHKALSDVCAKGSDVESFHAYLTNESGLIDRSAPVAAAVGHHCWLWKPFLDGTVLTNEYGLKGAGIGSGTAEIIAWQLTHPKGTKQELIAYFETKHPKLDPAAIAAAAAAASKKKGGGGAAAKK